jgi:hypothetical protein
MLNLTLEQLFGAGATQDSQSLTIQKASLPGLSAAANNRGEQLLAALMLQAWGEFEGELVDSEGSIVVDNQGFSISYDNQNLYEKLRIWFWKRQFIEDKVLNTFVIDVFIKPHPAYGTALNPNQLNY